MMRKFTSIYRTVRAFPEVRLSDYSFWRYPAYAQTTITRNSPLHLVLEDEKQHKRIWVMKYGNKYHLTVANTFHPFDSPAYSATQMQFELRSRRETVETLKWMLNAPNEELFGRIAA